MSKNKVKMRETRGDHSSFFASTTKLSLVNFNSMQKVGYLKTYEHNTIESAIFIVRCID